jgi:hypothetical protein
MVERVEGMIRDFSTCRKNGNRCNRGKKLEEAGKEDGGKRQLANPPAKLTR